MPETMDDVIGLIKGPAANDRADTLLMAMVAAAKADGKLSESEVDMIKAHNPETVADLEAMLAIESDPKAIAALAKNDQQAAEIYAVSCRVANGLNATEREYLDAADAPGVCREKPQMCTMDYTPVCGCDEQTYSNECAANAKGVSAAYLGECK